MSALTELEASITAAGVAIDAATAKVGELRAQVAAVPPSDDEALAKAIAGIDALIARIAAI